MIMGSMFDIRTIASTLAVAAVLGVVAMSQSHATEADVEEVATELRALRVDTPTRKEFESHEERFDRLVNMYIESKGKEDEWRGEVRASLKALENK